MVGPAFIPVVWQPVGTFGQRLVSYPGWIPVTKPAAFDQTKYSAFVRAGDWPANSSRLPVLVQVGTDFIVRENFGKPRIIVST